MMANPKISLLNFLLVGAARSGTTFLYNYLCRYSDVFMCMPKAPDFFLPNLPICLPKELRMRTTILRPLLKKPVTRSDIMEYLQQCYHQEIVPLQLVTGKDLGHWLNSRC